MNITTKNLERLAKNCGYSPEEMGMAILKMLGYKVKRFDMCGSVYVHSKESNDNFSINNKLLYYYEGVSIY